MRLTELESTSFPPRMHVDEIRAYQRYRGTRHPEIINQKTNGFEARSAKRRRCALTYVYCPTTSKPLEGMLAFLLALAQLDTPGFAFDNDSSLA